MLTANTSNTLLFICQIDVGGSRSRIQRMKWVRVIENKDFSILLYFAAVSEYDQVLNEDGRTNRLEESLNLFKDILGSKYFVEKEVILLMTKTDLLKQKLQDGYTSFKKYFPTINSSFPR